MMLVPPSSRAAGSPSARFARLVAIARLVRARARLISALVLLSFVLCHLTSHMFLIVSLPVAGLPAICRGAHAVGARLHRLAFLAAHQALVSGLAPHPGNARGVDPSAGACRLCRRRESDPARSAESGLRRDRRKQRKQETGNERSTTPHRSHRTCHLCRPCVAAVCRTR